MTKVNVPRKILRFLSEILEIFKQSTSSYFTGGISRLSIYIVFIAMAVVWILSPLSSFTLQWMPILCEDEDQHANWSYDKESVKFLPNDKVQVLVEIRSGGNILTTLRLRSCQISNKLAEEGSSTYEIRQYEFNCKTGEERVISVTYYDRNKKILCKETASGIKWTKIKPGSCSRVLYKILSAKLSEGKK